jgi:hypothetical protein
MARASLKGWIVRREMPMRFEPDDGKPDAALECLLL